MDVKIILDDRTKTETIITDWIKSVNIPIYADMKEENVMFHVVNWDSKISIIETSESTSVIFNSNLNRWEIPKLYDSKDVVGDVPVPFFLDVRVLNAIPKNILLIKTHFPAREEWLRNNAELLDVDNPGIMFHILKDFFGEKRITTDLSNDSGHYSTLYLDGDLLAIFYKRSTGFVGQGWKGTDPASIAELMVLLLPPDINRDDFILPLENNFIELFEVISIEKKVPEIYEIPDNIDTVLDEEANNLILIKNLTEEKTIKNDIVTSLRREKLRLEKEIKYQSDDSLRLVLEEELKEVNFQLFAAEDSLENTEKELLYAKE